MTPWPLRRQDRADGAQGRWHPPAHASPQPGAGPRPQGARLHQQAPHQAGSPRQPPFEGILGEERDAPGALEHVFHTIICPKQASGATNQHSPSGQGAGTLAMAGRAAPEAWPGASPSPGEERRERLSQSQSTTRREAHGRLAMPRKGPRRRIARCAGPRCASGRLASPNALTTRALLLGALEDGGGGEAKGDGTSAVSASSAGRGLWSKVQ